MTFDPTSRREALTATMQALGTRCAPAPPKIVTRRRRLLAAAILLALLACVRFLSTASGQGAAATGEQALWQAIASGGHVVLMRHALAPGVGDTPGFRLERCDTQRNLSAEGRRQAIAIGKRFRRNGAGDVRVHSSRWCRCLDTARLLALGEVVAEPSLDSFFAGRGSEPEQTRAVRELAHGAASGRSLLLVTHQVNITALTGEVPGSGEMLVLRPDGKRLVLLGRIAP